MQELLDQLTVLFKGLWTKKWYAIVVAWAVCLIAWPIVLKMPDQYRSSAKVYVDTQSLLKPLLRGLTIQSDPSEQIRLMSQTLLSRPNLEKIARLTDLDLTTRTPAEFDLLLRKLREDIRFSKARRENIFTITYSNPNPNLAKNVVQSTLTTLVENTLGDKRTDTVNAQSFLDRQIAEYEAKLDEAARKVTVFKQANVAFLTGSAGSFYNGLTALRGQIRDIQLSLNEALQRKESLELQLEDLEDSEEEEEIFGGDFMTAGQATIYDSRISVLEQELDALQLKYTDRHPLIRETKRKLESLRAKQQQETEQQASMTSSESGGIENNPVYQSVKLNLSQELANIQSLKVRLANYQERLKAQQQKLDTVPEVEAEFAALQRGHTVVQRKYSELLTRRESARLSESAEADTDSLQFRVIEPPRVPNNPDGPNRPLFLSGALVAAIGIGIAIAAGLSILNPTFLDTRQLYAVTGVPVLGSVTLLHSQEVIKAVRRRGYLFVSLGILLVALYGLLMGLQLNPQLNQSLMERIPDLTSAPVIDSILNKLKTFF